MTDGPADSETTQACSGDPAQPEVRIPRSSSDALMFETMARLHLQNDPLAPWGGEVETRLFRDTPMWGRLPAPPITGKQATQGAGRGWRRVLLAVASPSGWASSLARTLTAFRASR